MEKESVSIEDIVILGNAVPDEISDNRKTVCTAGYSEDLGLIRIYPVPPDAGLNRWAIVGIDLERNPKDNRKESWKITGSKSDWDRLKSKIRKNGNLKRKEEQIELIDTMLEKYGVKCVSDLNSEKKVWGL